MNTASPAPDRSGRVVNPTTDATLMEAARAAGLPIGSSCSGRGACGWCRVTVLAGELAPPDARERALLHKLEASPNERIACLAQMQGSVTIRTSYW